MNESSISTSGSSTIGSGSSISGKSSSSFVSESPKSTLGICTLGCLAFDGFALIRFFGGSGAGGRVAAIDCSIEGRVAAISVSTLLTVDGRLVVVEVAVVMISMSESVVDTSILVCAFFFFFLAELRSDSALLSLGPLLDLVRGRTKIDTNLRFSSDSSSSMIAKHQR